MQAIVKIRGTEPLIQHSAAGLDTRTEIAQEIKNITGRRGNNRTEPDEFRLEELETLQALWREPSTGDITVPPEAVRSCLETAARKLKQGADVREGLLVEKTTFDYNRKLLGETAEEVARNAQFKVPVVVQRNRVLRTRPKFDTWSLTFILDCDDQLIDQLKLENWLDIAGRRIGLGDWRPEKGGRYGRFIMESIDISPD